MKTSLFAGGAAALLLLTSSAFAEKQHFTGVITSAAELTAHTTTACAVAGDCTMSFTYDTESHRICGHASVNQTLNVTAAHLHEGDATIASGPVVVDLGFSGVTSTKELAFDVKATDQKALTDIPAAFAEADDTVSHIYFNLHTSEDGNGAVRANIHPDPTNNKNLDECLEFDQDAGTDGGGPITTPTDGGGTTVTPDSGTTTTTNDTTSSCSTAPGTSPGSVLLMLGAAIAVGSIVRSRKKR